jgi:hypothetical protein
MLSCQRAGIVEACTIPAAIASIAAAAARPVRVVARDFIAITLKPSQSLGPPPSASRGATLEGQRPACVRPRTECHCFADPQPGWWAARHAVMPQRRPEGSRRSAMGQLRRIGTVAGCGAGARRRAGSERQA